MDFQQAPKGLPLPVMNRQAREEAFGYTCNGCMSCCYRMNVMVNPYESARLARRLGITTGQFRRKYTRAGKGAILRERKKSGACVFLGEKGCTVYPDRPMVCRVYPLGRNVSFDGDEAFEYLEPLPTTAGVYSKKGTIQEFLDNHGAEPFMLASDEYYAWYLKASELLEQGSEEADAPSVVIAPDLLDLDSAVASYCSEKAIAEPTDIEERKAIHLLALNDALKIQAE